MPAIATTERAKKYEEHTVVDRLNLSIEKGEIFASPSARRRSIECNYKLKRDYSMSVKQVLKELKAMGRATPENLAGMQRFGIKFTEAYCVGMPALRKYAKKFKNDHALALALWKSDVHDAKLLAAMVDDPAQVTERQMDRWVKDFSSWDICDGCCGTLFDKTPFAYNKAAEWSNRKEEYIKRAGFVLMAELAAHDKEADNKKFTAFFPAMEREAWDEHNFVRKAINWALRQIGKRNKKLHKEAIRVAKRIQQQDTKSARWIAADALRELQSDKAKRWLK